METNDVAVSVLMLAYNHGKYIAQALDSVLNQVTNFKFEVIVGEDCSPAPDKSREILLEYKRRYGEQLVLVLHDHNVGPTENGLSIRRKARGKYTCGLECDDYWTDMNKLQRQYDLLEAHPEYSACGSAHKDVTDSGKDINACNLFMKKDRVFTMSDYAHRGYTLHNNTLMKREQLFSLDNPAYIKLRNVSPTMGDVTNFAILYANGPIYVFKDVMLAHREGSKVSSSFSKQQETKMIYYSYLQMRIADALAEYFNHQIDFSFIVVNRLAEVLFARVFASKRVLIDKSEMKALFRANPLRIRIRAFLRFGRRTLQRGKNKVKRNIYFLINRNGEEKL